MFDSDAEPTQWSHEQSYECDPRKHTEHHHRDRDRRELLGVAPHDGIDQHGQIEFDVRLADAHAAVKDRGRDQQPRSISRHPKRVILRGRRSGPGRENRVAFGWIE